MIFGLIVTPIMLVGGGAFITLLLLAQILVGMRKIRFQGKLHAKVHKWGAWVLLGIALFHGFLGIVYAVPLRIG
jgi:hypothetical protein